MERGATIKIKLKGKDNGTAKEKTKKKKTFENKDKVKERVRRHRSKMTEEQLEMKRAKDREYRKNKRAQETPFENQSEKEKKVMRANWRKWSNSYRARQNAVKQMNAYADLNSPPTTPDNSPNIHVPYAIAGPSNKSPTLENNNVNIVNDKRINVNISVRKAVGRKKIRRENSVLYRKIRKLEENLSKMKKINEKYRKRLQRNIKPKTICQASPSPLSKVTALCSKTRNQITPEIKKKLVFAEVVTSQLKKNKKQCNDQEKRTIVKVLACDYLKKYKIMRTAKGIIEYRDLKKFRCNPTVLRRANTSIMKREGYQVVKFLSEDENSMMCPGKRDSKKNVQKRILLAPMKVLHKKYKTAFASKMSYTSFLRLTPFWIIHPRMTHRQTCICAKHANFQFLVDKLHDKHLLPTKRANAVPDLICCSGRKKLCLYTKCPNCSDCKLLTRDNDLNNESVNFFQWENVQEKRTIRGCEKVVKRTVKRKYEAKVSDLLYRFNKMLPVFLRHVYNISHQYKETKSKLENLANNEVLIKIDFSENYVCKLKEEVQAMHFGASKVQLSLHTGVLYYRDENVGKTSFATISECLNHDASGVWAHLKPILIRLNSERSHVDTIHFSSDGPTAQYRNRYNFFLISTVLKDLCPNVKTCTWNFSEAGHGKGPMDGIGGTLKRTADRCVLHGEDIASANDFVKVLTNACPGIFLTKISSEDVAEMRQLIDVCEIVAIPSVMRTHQIVWHAEASSTIYIRELSCFECQEVCCHHSLGKGRSLMSISSATNHVLEIPEDSNKNNCTMEVYNVGDWVAVLYDEEWYPGIVKTIVPGKLAINFMCRSGQYFMWPTKPDEQEVNDDGVLCNLEEPVRVSSRLFKFNDAPVTVAISEL